MIEKPVAFWWFQEGQKLINLINPLQPGVAFRGYRKATLGWNGLNSFSVSSEIWT